jgi:hypothetical protein
MDPLKDEGPSWSDDRPSGIENLPSRVGRYEKAKGRALDVADYIAQLGGGPWSGVKRLRLSQCGDYLLFRHYLAADQVRLHAAQFCRYHLLCPLCAIRRGAKALEAYVPRYEAIRQEKPRLSPFLVTLTVKDGPDLLERFQHLRKGLQELAHRRRRARGVSVWEGIAGAVWSYEVKRGSGSGLWHPHAHAFVLAETIPYQAELRREWHELTGDSFMCDVRPIVGDVADGFCEVFKYAVKFSEMDLADTVHAATVLRGKRLISSSGAFYGVEVPEALEDEPLEGPYVEMMYRYLAGRGYGVAGTLLGERKRPTGRSKVDWDYYWQELRRAG